ncbi:SMI1/KNR4 family protein [Actinomadura adrarensis]|uniref:SMI1/KNR4 family protein n=1 Tax=Actinomadura adrarensis TaxID=1819600 RepID=A0ABW3CRM0_9ACTN
MTELEKLLALVPPPMEPVDGDADWGRVEEALGLRLPPEFIAVARRYGRGTFCSTYSYCDPDEMIEQNPRWADDQRFLLEDDGIECPHPVYPEPGGLLYWGSDPVGGGLCWVTEPSDSPERWKTLYWTRDDDFLYPEGGVAAVLTGLIEDLLARDRENGSNVDDGPWFSPYSRDVHVYLQLTESEGAPPYRERLRVLREHLAPTTARGSYQNATGERQDHFAAANGRWKLTYETVYAHQIRVAYPPGDDGPVRDALLPAVEAMGCRATVTQMHGVARWPELERD